MTDKQAKKTFDRYNPESAVVRCPNGRSQVRKSLDIYAKAAVNLYGIISRDELAELFNRQNAEQTTADEIFILLLPLVLKNKWYCFYKNHIVHYWLCDDFDDADYFLREQGDKPRYIPDREEFLKFENIYYESDEQRRCWTGVLEYIRKEWPQSRTLHHFYNELKEMSFFGGGVKEIGELLDKYGLIAGSEKAIQRFLDLYMKARNNTRIWHNKGYSPDEMFRIMESRQVKEESSGPLVRMRTKIGENDLCPCGSGKKYRECCKRISQAGTAQLSRRDCILFYETWYGLMGFVNDTRRVIGSAIRPVYPNPVSDEQSFKVREVLWKNTGLIDAYIDSVPLPEEKVELLKSWRDHFIAGSFLLAEYDPEYALAIAVTKKLNGRIYAIKGISRPISDTLPYKLPIQVDLVLIPFKDKIIYDGFSSTYSITFADGAAKMIRETCESAKKQGIITRLDG